jgi:hypothetical protein
MRRAPRPRPVQVAAVAEDHRFLGQHGHAECRRQGQVTPADHLGERQPAEISGSCGGFGVEVAVRVEPDQGRRDAALLDSADDGKGRHAVPGEHDRNTVGVGDLIDGMSSEGRWSPPQTGSRRTRWRA